MKIDKIKIKSLDSHHVVIDIVQYLKNGMAIIKQFKQQKLFISHYMVIYLKEMINKDFLVKKNILNRMKNIYMRKNTRLVKLWIIYTHLILVVINIIKLHNIYYYLLYMKK